MNEVATFFRHRANDPGETYQLEIGSASVSVYSRKPIQSGPGKLQTLEDLRAAVANEGGGGFLVSAIDEGRMRSLTVRRIDSRTSQSADQFVLLSPGRMAGFQPVDGKSHKVPLGSHAIVPVDAKALSELETFIGHLSWLSPDLESLVLNAIRRPSLETRLSKVESRVFGQTADEPTRPGSIDRPGTSNGGLLKPKVFRVAMVVLSILLLGAVGFVVYRARLKAAVTDTSGTTSTTSTTSSAVDTAHTVAETGTGVGVNPAIVVEPQAPIAETRELLGALERTKNPVLASLRKIQFNGIKSTSTNEEITALFQKHIKGSKNRGFLWGLIKLQALKLKPDLLAGGKEELTFLSGPEMINPTKTVFAKIGQPTRDGDPDGRDLLAALSCRLGYETQKKPSGMVPGLPEYPSPPKEAGDEALVFIEGGDCNAFMKVDIKKGLQHLTEFVKKTPE